MILLVFLAGLAASAYFFNALNANITNLEQAKKTTEALAIAKAALIGRAVADRNHPGSLGCPDNAGSGSSPLLTGNQCPAYVGRFPWKTLKTGELTDGYGENIWYAIAPAYIDDNSAEPVDGSRAGISVDGSGGDIEAIVFSPGPPLAAQNGRPSNRASDYLEGENSDGDLDFSAMTSADQNDRLITISRAEIFAAVSRRILLEIRGDASRGLIKYYADNGHLYPDTLDQVPSDTMLSANGWITAVNYTVTADQQAATLTLNGNTLRLP